MRKTFRLAGKVYGLHNAQPVLAIDPLCPAPRTNPVCTWGNRRIMRNDGLRPAQNVLVIGLGYVGLPLAAAAARSGFRVTGLDVSAATVSGLMAGRSHVDDVA